VACTAYVVQAQLHTAAAKQACRRCCADWTQPPGLRFQDGTGALSGKRVVTVPAGRLEFVLTNGEGSWDTPGLGAGSKNYRISEPGTWVLRHGSLSRARM